MKKAVSLLLLSIFLFNAVGYYLVFKVAQSEVKSKIKKELKLQLDSEELTVIRFSLKDVENIHWIKEGKEFIHLDQMFDIVKIIADSSSVIYHCINDKQEKELFVHLEEQVSKQLEHNKNSKSKNFVKTDYFEENRSAFLQKTSSLSFLIYSRYYPAVEPTTSVPPPRI